MLPALLLFVVVALSVVFFLYTRSLRRAQKEHSQGEERFRQMADHVQEIFLMIDCSTKRALYVNHAYEVITGRSCRSLQEDPRSYEEAIHPEDRPHVLAKLEEASRTGGLDLRFRNMGRLIGTTTQYSFLPGRTFSNSYSYDKASNRTGYTDPEGGTISYGYDTLNRLTSLNSSLAGQFSFGYDELSRRTSLTRPNGVVTRYNYDSVSRLLQVKSRCRRLKSWIEHQCGWYAIDLHRSNGAGNLAVGARPLVTKAQSIPKVCADLCL